MKGDSHFEANFAILCEGKYQDSYNDYQTITGPPHLYN